LTKIHGTTFSRHWERQYRTVTPQKRETKKINSVTALAFCLETFLALSYRVEENKLRAPESLN
jgi:hypothetical protein